MKNLILLFVILQFLFAQDALTQKEWIKYEENPVLQPGAPGSWDDESVDMSTVLFDGTIYHMWYAGLDGVYFRIGHATSADGVSWTKDPANPVLDVGPPGSWEESMVYMPTVILNNGVFHMWYDGAWGNIEKIGHATSTDGSNWTKDPLNPVIDVGPPGSWDELQVFPTPGSVILENGVYKMWYGGGNNSWVWQIGYAISGDGSVWTKDAGNPVMSMGNSGEWDSYSVISGTVRLEGNEYRIWYSGCANSNRWRVGYATSSDGISWDKYSCNPVLDYGPLGSWDYQQAWNASVVFDSTAQKYMMWYTGGPFNEGNIGLASSRVSKIINVPCDYLSIQEGIDAATPGDTVLVDDGTYFENINFKGKAITVASQFLMDSDTNHINNTIIDGSTAINPDSAATVLFANDEDTTSIICGFSITGGGGNYGVIFTSDLQFGGGISIWECGAKILHNKIYNNWVENDIMAAGGGIGCFVDLSEKWVVIENNKIFGNTSYATDFWGYGGGIYVGTNCRITSNIVKNNTTICDGGNADGGGVETETYIGNTNTCIVSDNIIHSNSVIAGDDAAGGGFCSSSSDVIAFNNSIQFNTVDGTNAYGGGIDLVDYVYNYPHLLIHNNNISNNVLIALDVAHGAGIRTRQSSLEFFENIISNNSLTNIDKYWAAGILVGVPVNSVEIYNNEFSNNIGDVLVNTGPGGGIAINAAFDVPLKIDKNIFYNNVAKQGAGLFFKNSYNITISNNIFLGDSALFGAGISTYQNTSGSGENTPLIVNNTFFDNHAIETGGALRIHGDEGTGFVSFNNLFWNNLANIQANDVFNNSGTATVHVYWSDIDEGQIGGSWMGGNNITQDPLFTDTLCHINGGPCHNAGIHELEVGGITYFAPDIDYDGDPRPQGPYWDIGADECLMVGITKPEPVSSLTLSVNPNPTSGVLHLGYSISETRNSKLEMYSADGTLVRTLVSSMQQRGKHELECDMNDLPNGLYLIRLQAGNQVETMKVILIK